MPAPEIRRETLFAKLNPIAYQTIEAATLFCRLRGNPHVELVHWVHQLLEHSESDWWRVLEPFGIDAGRLSADMTQALERLPRGATSVQDLAPRVDQAVERAWMYTSLSFGESAIRTGHILLAALQTPELNQALRAISRQFDAIAPDALGRRFEALLGHAPESKLARPDERLAAPGTGTPAPSPLGKREALQRYAVDLTARAKSGELDPVSGRDPELRQVVDILMRRRQNNPILTGEAGVGKTAVVEALAQRIAQGDVPEPLRDVTLYALDLGLLAAGASVKGEFEQRLRQVIDDVQASARPIILFIDEAHTLIGAGGAAGTGDAANLLKPALARGRLRTIAATTWAEYKKHIEPDPALTRRFQVVQVAEPSEEGALRMLRGMVPALEAHHRVSILDDALAAAVELSHRYIPARQLPDKAVSLIDTACARVAISRQAPPPDVEDTRRTLEALACEHELLSREAALGCDVAERLARTEERQATGQARLHELEQRWRREQGLCDRILKLHTILRGELGDSPARTEALGEHARLQVALREVQGDAPLIAPTVDHHAVSRVVSDWTGIPVGRMVRDQVRSVLRLADTLGQRVLGQRHALDMIAQRIRTTRAGLEDPRKPSGVFLLAGPSGVGKTETAHALAEALYGGEASLIRINMSEFQESHTVSTLKGAPPGYVGYGEGGVLTEAVRRRPYSVVLLDEIEKAHPDVHELFFQVFDKGVMEDGEGRSIDFRNTLILLTTNVGSELILHACRDGSEPPAAEALAKALRGPLLEVFPAALLGRMVTVPYYSLGDALLREIVELQLRRVAARVRARYGVPLEYGDDVLALLASRCNEVESGARTVEALLATTLLPRLSEAFLGGLVDSAPIERIRLGAALGELTYDFSPTA
jgi:type VI secretion system protein VasG